MKAQTNCPACLGSLARKLHAIGLRRAAVVTNVLRVRECRFPDRHRWMAKLLGAPRRSPRIPYGAHGHSRWLPTVPTAGIGLTDCDCRYGPVPGIPARWRGPYRVFPA